MPTVNCAFGPKSSFLLWIDEGPGRDHKPKYTSSAKLPDALLEELNGWQPHTKRIHSVAVAPGNGGYALSIETTAQSQHTIFDLSSEYDRLKGSLKEAEKEDRGKAILSIGPDGDFFLMSKGHPPHCHSKNNKLEDSVIEMGTENIVMVTLGKASCGLILDKRHKIITRGVLSAHYKTLQEDLDKYMDPDNRPKKPVSVSLNAFKEDEYFIMFEDNTFCYKSKALGGHCEPPTQRGSKKMKRTFTIQTPLDAAQMDQQKIEIIQAQKFDNLMNSWKIKPPGLAANDPNPEWEIQDFGNAANVSDPYRWLSAPKLDSSAPSTQQQASMSENWPQVYG